MRILDKEIKTKELGQDRPYNLCVLKSAGIWLGKLPKGENFFVLQKIFFQTLYLYDIEIARRVLRQNIFSSIDTLQAKILTFFHHFLHCPKVYYLHCVPIPCFAFCSCLKQKQWWQRRQRTMCL